MLSVYKHDQLVYRHTKLEEYKSNNNKNKEKALKDYNYFVRLRNVKSSTGKSNRKRKNEGK